MTVAFLVDSALSFIAASCRRGCNASITHYFTWRTYYQGGELFSTSFTRLYRGFHVATIDDKNPTACDEFFLLVRPVSQRSRVHGYGGNY